MATQFDGMTCDIQFSLRVPKSMADEITARAAAEGIKPASWIRRTISAAIINSDEKALNSLKSDVIKLIENDKDIQSAILKIAGSKEFEREKIKEAESKFKRLKKVTENRIDELLKQKKSIQKEIESINKQITSIENKINKYNPGHAQTQSDIKYIELLRGEQNDKRGEIEALNLRLSEIDKKTESAKAELEALNANAENAEISKNTEISAALFDEKKVWQDDLERLEEMEDE